MTDKPMTFEEHLHKQIGHYDKMEISLMSQGWNARQSEIDAKDAEIARLTAERDEATGKALRAANACVWNDFEVPISELDPGWIVGSISERINKLTPPLIDLWDKLRLVEVRLGETRIWNQFRVFLKVHDPGGWTQDRLTVLDAEASSLRQQIAELEGKS